MTAPNNQCYLHVKTVKDFQKDISIVLSPYPTYAQRSGIRSATLLAAEISRKFAGGTEQTSNADFIERLFLGVYNGSVIVRGGPFAGKTGGRTVKPCRVCWRLAQGMDIHHVFICHSMLLGTFLRWRIAVRDFVTTLTQLPD